MATPAPRCGSGNARGRVIGTLRVIVITLLPIVSGQDLELNQVLRGAAESLGRHDYAECQELARSAIDIDARVPEAHALLARALTYDSKYALAERALRTATDELGIHALHKDLGQLFQYMLDPPKNTAAIEQYQRYLSHFAEDAGIHNDVALLYAGENLPDAAVKHYRLAISLDSNPPTDYRARTNLGLLLVRMPGSSRESWAEGIDLQAEAIDIAKRLSQLHNDSQAHRDLPTLLLNMGSVVDSAHQRAGPTTTAPPVSYWHKALSLNPNLTLSLDAIANKHAGAGEHEQAFDYYDRAVEAARSPTNQGTPHYGPALAAAIRIKAATLLPRVYGSSDKILQWRWRYMRRLQALLEEDAASLQIADNPARAALDMGYYLVYQGLENRRPREMLAKIYLKACPSLGGGMDGSSTEETYGDEQSAMTVTAGSIPALGRRFRVGFFSEYWSEHTTTKLLGQVLTGLARDKYHSELSVELISTAQAPRVSFTKDLEASVGPILQVPGVLDLAESRRMIRDRDLDVLVFAEIGMGMSAYFLAFAAKTLAKRTVAFWGHGVTSGIDTIDYFVTSRMFHGVVASSAGVAAVAQAAWTERLYLMNSITTAFEMPPEPSLEYVVDLRDLCGISNGDPHFYLAPTSLYKFHPLMDIPLSRLLIKDRRAVLVMVEGNEMKWSRKIVGRLREAVKRRVYAMNAGGAHAEASYHATDPNAIANDAGSRIVVVPAMRRKRYLSFLKAGHVVALPFPTTSAVTAMETIAAGTPFVTLGESSSSYLLQHYAPALLAQLGMSESDARDCCIALDLDDYADKLFRFANDGAFRERISAVFREKSYLLFGDEAHRIVVEDWAIMFRNISTRPRPRSIESK